MQLLTCRNLLRFIVDLQYNRFAAQRSISLQINANGSPSSTIFTSWLEGEEEINLRIKIELLFGHKQHKPCTTYQNGVSN